jgi:hypothetical protein
MMLVADELGAAAPCCAKPRGKVYLPTPFAARPEVVRKLRIAAL